MERFVLVSAWRNHAAKYQGTCRYCGHGAPQWIVNVRCENVFEERPAFGKVHKVQKTVMQYMSLCGSCKAKLVVRERQQAVPDEKQWLMEKKANFEKEQMYDRRSD